MAKRCHFAAQVLLVSCLLPQIDEDIIPPYKQNQDEARHTPAPLPVISVHCKNSGVPIFIYLYVSQTRPWRGDMRLFRIQA